MGKLCAFHEGLKTHPQKFFRYFRMSDVTFDKLLVLLCPSLMFPGTGMRKSVPAEQRLAVALR